MAYDAQGRWVPDSNTGATPTPAGATPPATAPATGGFGARAPIPGWMGAGPAPTMTAPTAAGGAAASTGTPTNLGTLTPGTSAFAGGFANAPNYGPGSVYDPVTAANTYGTTHGIDPYSGQNAVNAQRASNLETVFSLLNGQAVEGAGPGQFADWENKYLAQGGQQGISTADFFNAAFTNDQKNPVWSMLHTQKVNNQVLTLTPADQVGAFIDLMDKGLANTVPPTVLKSMDSMYAQAGSQYIQAINSGQFNGSFTDWCQQQGLGPQMLTGGQ